MRLTTAAAGAASLLLVVGLAACSGVPEPGAPLPTGEPAASEPAEGGATPSASPSEAVASPTPGSTETPVAAPTLPPEATTNDAAGAEAFTRYWYEALNFAYATGDPALMLAASSSDCTICSELAQVVDDAYVDGGRLVGGAIQLRDASSPAPDNRGITLVSIIFDQEALAQLDEQGDIIRSEESSSGVSAGVVLERNERDDGWLYYGAGQ